MKMGGKKDIGTKATGNHFSLILYSSSPTPKNCHTFEVRQCRVYVCACECVLKEKYKALSWLVAQPPSHQGAGNLRVTNECGFYASIRPC